MEPDGSENKLEAMEKTESHLTPFFILRISEIKRKG